MICSEVPKPDANKIQLKEAAFPGRIPGLRKTLKMGI